MIRFRFILFACCFAFTARAQVEWISLDELSDRMEGNPKPVFVFIHAPWCGYCRMMEKNVFTDGEVGRGINQDYYSISIDAENSDTLMYRGVLYPPDVQPNGKMINRLAKQIGEVDGKLTFPTCVFLDTNLVVRAQYNSYLKKSELTSILKTLTK